MANKKNNKTKSEDRGLRIQRIIFLAICVIIVLAMVLGMLAK